MQFSAVRRPRNHNPSAPRDGIVVSSDEVRVALRSHALIGPKRRRSAHGLAVGCAVEGRVRRIPQEPGGRTEDRMHIGHLVPLVNACSRSETSLDIFCATLSGSTFTQGRFSPTLRSTLIVFCAAPR